MNYNYLIVEDNLGCLANLRTALKSHSNFLEVGVANTLIQGISLALTTKPHLIFLDVQLGDENGFDLIKEIRQYSADFPFIIMTTDFDKYANGGWFARTEIPADQASAGVDYDVYNLTQRQLRQLVTGAPAASQVGGLYQSFIDEALKS